MRRSWPAALGAASAALALALAVSPPRAARAHQSSIKYVDLAVDDRRVTVRFTVAPYDVTAPNNLPDDATPTAEAAATPAAAAYVARWLALSLPDGRPCAPSPPRALLDPDRAFVVATWDATCPAPIDRLRVDLSAFFAVDARHEVIVSIHPPGEHADPHVIRARAPIAELAALPPPPPSSSPARSTAAAALIAAASLTALALALARSRRRRRHRRRHRSRS